MERNKNFSNWRPPRPPATWSRSENKKFVNALAIYGIENPEIWKIIAATLPGKSPRDIEEHYETLVHDITRIEMGRIKLPEYKNDFEGDCDHDGDGLIDETAGGLRETADVHENGILDVGISDVHETAETLRDIPSYNQVSDVHENGILEVGANVVRENDIPDVRASDLHKKGMSEVGVSDIDENVFLEVGVSDVHENRFLEVSDVHENGFLEFSNLHENRFLEVGVSDVHENGSLQVMLTDDVHNNGFLEARTADDVHNNGFLEARASNDVHENGFLDVGVSDVHENESLQVMLTDDVHNSGFVEARASDDVHENDFLKVGVSDVHENGSLQVMLTDDVHNNGFLEARASDDVHGNGFLEVIASNGHENDFLEVSDVHCNRSLEIGVSDVLGVEVSHVHEKGNPELGARLRKRGRSWTEEEHRNFLMGLDHERRGDWKTISRLYIPSKTPAQISSHAQKYFKRQKVVESGNARRKSIHDITKME
ncbi:uncharacterized protein A4U43_C04F7140 [Asparagus officinalis]|uniref:Uncharacterized protein n=1 Tax=Asparagus officinalis TaxID=4686 RepID=A0A5P1F3D6_ASPOF|nr:uncharacterized protein LOC109836792 [Asparagus officinalis]ONK71309.1 uncharacterized protein A4U43_C04F7140 [Asparagus officinalis]